MWRATLYDLERVQACAGPGAQPPCLQLETFAPSCGYASTYTDRSGTKIQGNVVAMTDWTYQTDLMQAVEGDYAILLSDGRTLSGHLRVCLLAKLHYD